MLRLAIHPLHNPKKLIEAYQPYIEFLNGHFEGIRIELKASRDDQAFENKFRQRKPELIPPNPWQTLEAIKVGYRVFAMAGATWPPPWSRPPGYEWKYPPL